MKKINLKNIVRWEQLTNKPFSKINFNNEDDLISFLYISSESGLEVPFPIFKKTRRSKAFINELSVLTKDLEIMNQFMKERDERDEKELDETDVYLSDVAFGLIAKGIAPDYIMSLTLPDLPYLLNAVEKEQQNIMEESRLWTYFSILPHVSKGLKGPASLIEFPWESAKLEDQRQKDLDESISLTKNFFENGKQ